MASWAFRAVGSSFDCCEKSPRFVSGAAVRTTGAVQRIVDKKCRQYGMLWYGIPEAGRSRSGERFARSIGCDFVGRIR